MGKAINVDWENMELIYLVGDDRGDLHEISFYEYFAIEEDGNFSSIDERIDLINNRWVCCIWR